jgi:serine/threonine-protein kinase
LAHGLAQYHRIANLVHGDISPANLILTPRTTRLVLVDFGSAWPVECSANKVNGDGVTFPYAAPERIAGHALEDFRSDHFSLCVVWYELLTMEIPLDGAGGKAGLPENIKAHATTLVLPSKKIASRRRLPARAIQLLDETLRVGLALHPDERFSTTRDWLDAVDRLHYLLRPGGEISGSGLWALAGFDWLQRSLHGLFCRK